MRPDSEFVARSPEPPPAQRGGSAGVDQAQGRAVQRLGGLFASEPELILAFLEAAPDATLAPTATVLAAAHEAIARHPNYADLHCYAARAAVRLGALHDAADLLERALAINPQYVDALILRARVAIGLDQPAQAIEFLTSALRLGADYADVHVMLGDLWRWRGEAERARAAYTRALQINPGLRPASAALVALGTETAARINA